MEVSKIFKALNQVIGAYQSKQITQRSLDCFLTIEIITECMMDVRQMGLTKGEMTILKKLTGKANIRRWSKKCMQSELEREQKKCDEEHPQPLNSGRTRKSGENQQPKTKQQQLRNQQQSLTELTVILIHENGHEGSNTADHTLTQSLLRNVDNAIVVDQQGGCYNNLLYHQRKPSLAHMSPPLASLLLATPNNRKTRPLIIICLNQYKKYKELPYKQQRAKRDHYFRRQMEKYLSTCDIFQGHLNLRVSMYSESQSARLVGKNTMEKLVYFAGTIIEYRESEDDYDVLLREQIPANAYIKIVVQCGNRVNYSYIKSLTNCYKIINAEPNLYYSFKVLHENQKQSNSMEMLMDDQMLIWALLNGQPILQLLPLYRQVKKRGRCGSKNDKFKQKRSILGYTQFQMEEKLCQSKKTQKGNQTQNQVSGIKNQQTIKGTNQNQEEADSIYGLGSDSGQNYSYMSELLDEQNCISQVGKVIQAKSKGRIYIINIVNTNIGAEQINQIITFEMKNLMKIFLEERKQAYRNLQVNKNLKYVQKIVEILDVNERDVYDVLYLSKL